MSDIPNPWKKEKVDKKALKRQKIATEFGGSKLAYWTYWAGFWLLFFIATITKIGFVGLGVSFGVYFLIFHLMYKKQNINIWASLITSLILAIASIVLVVYLALTYYSSKPLAPVAKPVSVAKPVAPISPATTSTQKP